MFNFESRLQFPDLSGVAVQSDASYLAPRAENTFAIRQAAQSGAVHRKKEEKANRKRQEMR